MENIMSFLQSNINEKMSLGDIVDVFEEMCSIPIEEDMVLFETGTFSFTGESMFQIALVRQFPNEDEEYYQIHVDVLYKPTNESKVFNEATWDEDLNEDIFDYIRRSPAFDYAKGQEYIKIDIYMDET